MDGVICPSEIVYDLLTRYKVTTKGVILQGLIWLKFERPENYRNLCEGYRKLAIDDSGNMFSSFVSVSIENMQL